MLHSQRLEQLLDLIELTSSTNAFYQVKERIAARLQEILGVERLTIHIIGRTEQQTLGLATSVGFSEALERFHPSSELIPFENSPGYMQEAMIHGTPVNISDLHDSSLAGDEGELAEIEGHNALLCLPLVARASVVGAITGYSDQPIPLSPEVERLALTCCMLIANMVDRERVILDHEELHEQL